MTKPTYEKFSLIGSGLQIKFGQTTIARQDISHSISDQESEVFLKIVKNLVHAVDPKKKYLKIEDTGLDIEIISTVDESQAVFKDFDKADGVRYLARELNLQLEHGPHLICGDTASDIPMIEATIEKTPQTWAIFVTTNQELAEKVKKICPQTIIVPNSDVLMTSLGILSKS